MIYVIDKKQEGEGGLPNQSHKFEEAKEEKESKKSDEPKEEKKPQRNFLEPNHSHFLLIDNGTTGKSNIEQDFRLRIEELLDKLWENVTSKITISKPFLGFIIIINKSLFNCSKLYTCR